MVRKGEHNLYDQLSHYHSFDCGCVGKDEKHVEKLHFPCSPDLITDSRIDSVNDKKLDCDTFKYIEQYGSKEKTMMKRFDELEDKVDSLLLKKNSATRRRLLISEGTSGARC